MYHLTVVNDPKTFRTNITKVIASNIDKNVEMPNIVLRGRRERAVRYGES